jgi:predicted phosphodiesterase
MKIAVFSDVHGNLVALQTLLDHLASGGFDAIYCLGDLFTPYPGSRAIWDLVKAAGVQCVLGNNEAALIAHLTGQSDYRADDEVRFQPFLKNAGELAPILEELQAIPLFRSIPLTEKLHLHLCHFSPDEVLRGLHSGTHFNMAEYTSRLAESIVLTGHMHTFLARDIQGKQVYTVGSAGLPLKGSHQFEYSVVEDRRGEFAISYHQLSYPFEQEVARLLQHRFLQEYGPVAWLAFDEILTQRDRIGTFLKDYLPAHNESPRDYYRLIEAFLRSLGRWEVIAGYLDQDDRQ